MSKPRRDVDPDLVRSFVRGFGWLLAFTWVFALLVIGFVLLS